jgi:hypothetical protein
MNQYSTIPAFFSINFYAAIPGSAGILPASFSMTAASSRAGAGVSRLVYELTTCYDSRLSPSTVERAENALASVPKVERRSPTRRVEG